MIKIFLFLILFLHLALLLILQFTSWPEMLSYPYLLSKGYILYKDFVMPYPPGLPLILSFIFNLFGYNPQVLRLFTFLIILLTDFLVFLNLNQINKTKINLIFLLLYVILQSLLDGVMLWFDYATLPFILIAILFINKSFDSKKLKFIFIAGLFFSLAVLVKQIAILYPLVTLFMLSLFFNKKNLKKAISYFLLGLLMPMLLFFIYLVTTSSLVDFWNWNFYYPLFDWSKYPGYITLEATKRQIVILLLPFVALALIFTKLNKLLNKRVFLIISLLIAAILAIYPRFSYFHFQPTLALLIILLFQTYHLLDKRFKYTEVMVVLMVIIIELFLLKPFNINSEIRFYNSSEIGLAGIIRKEVVKESKIYLLGPDSSLYALADRLPPKPWIDTFGWYMEIPGVQDQLIKGFINNPPQLIAYTLPLNGNPNDLGTYKPKKVLEYMYQNYYRQQVFEGVELWMKKQK